MTKEKYESLLQTLHECMEACNHCYDACLQESEVHMMASCIRLDRECADFCGYVEQAITRKSPFIAELVAVCAIICEACGKECEKHNHEHCQRCAEKCFQCAEACRQVA